HLDRVDPVIGAVVPEPDRDDPEDAVPLVAAEVIGDLLGDQDRPVTLDGNPRVVTDDLLRTGLRARSRWRGQDRAQDRGRDGTRQGDAGYQQGAGTPHGSPPPPTAGTACPGPKRPQLARRAECPPCRRTPGTESWPQSSTPRQGPGYLPGNAIVVPPAMQARD